MESILVVGAGPVGLTMACELARFGLPVRIIDKAAHATSTSKALVIWSRTLELMDRMGCTAPFLDAGLRAHGATLRHGSKVLGQTSLDSIASAYDFALMLPQSDTERLLTAHLHGLGISIEREIELAGFSDAGGQVTATLKHAGGREEQIQTPWLIGCDGAHSTVRHGLAVDFHGETEGDDWMLADVRLEGDAAPAADDIGIYFHHDGPFIIFPMPGGRARIVTTVGKTNPGHRRPDPTLEEVQAMVDRRAGGGFRVTDPKWLSNFNINERKVTEYRRGRVFLAGDAAHIHSPAGGQGMNTGMQDALNLSWKLAMVEQGAASPALLDSYSPERSAVGIIVLRNATRLTDFGTLSNPVAQVARNAAAHFVLGFHAVQARMATQMSEIDIAYAHSPLSHGRHAGDRLPPSQYDGAPPGSGKNPRFVLFAADAEKAEALTARFPALLESRRRTPPDASRLLIVRPDGYVGLSDAADDGEEAARYLTALLPMAA